PPANHTKVFAATGACEYAGRRAIRAATIPGNLMPFTKTDGRRSDTKAYAVRLIYKLIARLPQDVQHLIRQFHFRYLIRRQDFLPDEQEFRDVERYARPGDWVIDVGANVGRYTCFMSRCVGESGRVLAFEPVLESFSLLTENVRTSRATNVS